MKDAKHTVHADGCNGKGTCQFCAAKPKPVPTFELSMTVTSALEGMTPAILAHAIQLAFESSGIGVVEMACKEVK